MDESEKKLEEQQNDTGDKLRVSRRGFLKGMGTGAIAATIAGTEAASPHRLAAALPPGLKETVVTVDVNGQLQRLRVRSHWTLLDVLRKQLGLTGTKKLCDRGSCGACTVIMEGKAIYSCSRLAIEADNKKIFTIEGLADGQRIHPIQQAFIENDGLQCSFCTSGMIMSVKALMDASSHPDAEQMKEALSGNICRCAAYPKILQSAMAVARRTV